MRSILVSLAVLGTVFALTGCSSDDSSGGPTGTTPTGDAAADSAQTDGGSGADAAQNDAAEGDAASDASQSDATSADAADGGQCNAVENLATEISVTPKTEAMPDGTGGTLEDGIYVLSQLEAYSGSILSTSTTKYKQTIEFKGGVGQLVADNSDKPHFTKTFGIKMDGAKVTTNTTCTTEQGAIDVTYATYTASATGLKLHAASPFSFVAVFTKK